MQSEIGFGIIPPDARERLLLQGQRQRKAKTMTNIKIDTGNGHIWTPERTRLEVVNPADLVGSDGYYNDHKIVEVAPISPDLVVIKTIGWES